MNKTLTLIVFCLAALLSAASAQEKSADAKPAADVKNKTSAPQSLKKANQRSSGVASKVAASEPFAQATVDAMAAQCVKLETEVGVVELEMFPESAPESVRSFLNLAASGSFDTTTFSRVVPGFIVQGGDLFTRLKMTPELDKRARRHLSDEPSLIRHERGIISMARAGEPNSATTSFFILVGEAPHLNGTFAAFGRVKSGMETVDAINKMPVEAEKPVKPVRLTRATVALCPAQSKP